MAISDSRMVEMYRKREMLKEQSAKLNARVDKINQKLIAEFERRGTKALEHDGQRITYVQAEPVIYPPEKVWAQLLRTEKGREILKRIVIEVIDPKALAAEVTAGNIHPRTLAKISEIHKNKPYITGSAVQNA